MVVDVLDLENYRAAEQLHREKLLVMCLATYGDGEPTDNAAEFFTWLSKEVEAVEAGQKQPPLEVRDLGGVATCHFERMHEVHHAHTPPACRMGSAMCHVV